MTATWTLATPLLLVSLLATGLPARAQNSAPIEIVVMHGKGG